MRGSKILSLENSSSSFLNGIPKKESLHRKRFNISGFSREWGVDNKTNLMAVKLSGSVEVKVKIKRNKGNPKII